MNRILGIDLGTTNSVMAIVEHNKPIVIQNKRGDRLTPSVIAYGKNDEVLVGKVAKNQSILNADKTINSIKRKMGTNEVIQIGKHKLTPQEISAKILEKLKEEAEEYLGEEISKAVITVPAYFNDNQRQATKDAGRLAGLEVIRIINEPTAAALAYGLNKNDYQNVLVYDLGGGTFDVSILEIGDGVFEVKATSGNNKLGGDDFDKVLLDYVLKKHHNKTGINLKKDIMAIQKLKEEIEKAKIELSEVENVELNIPFISADENGPHHLVMEIQRSDFEDLIQEYVEETISLTNKAIQDSGLTKDEIDSILLVGGSTKIPYLQSEVKKFLGKVLIKGINPDECVALGAAIQASILSGEKTGMVLVDVIPLSLGIEIEGGIFVPVIERNTPIPTSASKLFTTISDYQKSVEIHIFQGERIRCNDNISLGKFQLHGIRPAKKGEPRIDVTFSINVDGLLEVSAKDLDTNSRHNISITNPNSLSEKDINKILDAAKKNKEKDVESVELKNAKDKFNAEYKKFKTLYEKHVNQFDSSLQKDAYNLIQKVEKNGNIKKASNYIDLLENVEFLSGEIKAVCQHLEKDEVEVS